MPIPQTRRVNPLDLQNNIAIGISLPFNGQGVFNSTYSTKDQIKSNLINLLLTNKGERIMNSEFGANLNSVLFDELTEDINEIIQELINTSVNIFIPEVLINNININQNKDNHSILISVNYTILL